MTTNMSCEAFLEALASSAPVPGGGGASALSGAMGAALGSMVANLTSGKKRYASVQGDIERILEKAETLRMDLFVLVEKDAKAFEPLSRAYGLPQGSEEERKLKEEVLEAALKSACEAPLEIMRKSLEVMDLHDELAKKGTRIAVSDVGVGVLFCKSSLIGASLNVFINTKLMKDRQYASQVNRETESLVAEGSAKADRIYRDVEVAIK
ncbi:MAG: cyclodeaminase/cyclohydrolase family protein [Rectinemataceae bacterium]